MVAPRTARCKHIPEVAAPRLARPRRRAYDAGSPTQASRTRRIDERHPAEHRGAAVGAARLRAPAGVHRAGHRVRSVDLRPCERRPRGLLGRASRPADLVQAVGHRDALDAAVGDLVRRRPAQRVVQLPRSPRGSGRRRQGRLPLGGRARRRPHDHVLGPARRGVPPRERPEVARCRQGRPGQRLPRHGARAADRDARVRSHRRRALGGVRRLQRRGAARPHQRCRGHGADHGRRSLAARHRRAAQGQRRRGGASVSLDRARDHRAALRQRARLHRGPGPLVPRARRRPAGRVRARADGGRGSALPALHERDDGQAQGHRAHDGRLHDPGRRHPPHDLRHPRRRRVLVRRRLRVGHRPFLHRVRAAREPHDRHHVRGRPGLARQGPLVGHRRASPGDHPVHGAHGDPGVHALGRRASEQARPVVAAAARVGRRAHQSRKRGSGTGR